MSNPLSPTPNNRDPAVVSMADRIWLDASEHLDKIVAYVKTLEPDIYAMAGNTDTSVLYDWLKGYIQVAEVNGGKQARDVTLLMAAAAITRLVREDERIAASNLLGELEKEIGKK